VCQTLEEMETYQEELQAEIDAKKESLAALEEAAAYYENQLLLAQERFEKLPLLSRVEAWVASQNELFAKEEYGEGLEQLQTLLTSVESHTATANQHKEALAAMESNQDEVNTPLANIRASMETMEGAAAEYHRQLLLNQERLQTLPMLDGVLAWVAEKTELFSSNDFGADLAAVAQLLEAHQPFPSQLERQKGVVDAVAPGQEVVQTKKDEVVAALGSVEQLGDDYHTQLLLSQERFEKLPVLENLSTWIDQQNELFATDDFGDTLGAVDALLSVFQTCVGLLGRAALC